jgi:hypothetical protein
MTRKLIIASGGAPLPVIATSLVGEDLPGAAPGTTDQLAIAVTMSKLGS